MSLQAEHTIPPPVTSEVFGHGRFGRDVDKRPRRTMAAEVVARPSAQKRTTTGPLYDRGMFSRLRAG